MGWTRIPDHARAALEHLAQKFAAKPAAGQVDLSWAHRIVARYQRGEVVAAAPLRMACEALNIPNPPRKEQPHGD